MKTALLVLFISVIISMCQLYTSDCKAQWVSIPDTNFGKWLNTHSFSVCLQGNSVTGWQMDTTCPAVVSATNVVCNASGIRDIEGIQYFDNLQNLYCTDNQLTGFPPLPPSLKNLLCYRNQISSLPALPSGLTSLDCSQNQLTVLPSLPSGVSNMNCASNQLSSLPALPNNLGQLLCFDNLLSSLPVLPAGMTSVRCFDNLLTAMPSLPDTLITLECQNNFLSALPTLPVSLTSLDCRNNQIVSLPSLPPGLISLHCSDNQLSSLPELPDSLAGCYIDRNPITCLPLLNKITYLSFANTLITCLSNYGVVTNSYPPLSTLPLCDVFNDGGCFTFLNVSGKVFNDLNANCTREISEGLIQNIPVKLWRGGTLEQQTNTGIFGSYSFEADSFTSYSLTIDTYNTPFYFTCPANAIQTATLSPLDSLHYDKDFALECNPGFDLAAWSIEGRLLPGNHSHVDIHVGSTSSFYGINSSGGISGNVTVVISGPATYVSPAPGALTPNNVSGNTLTYNVADFGNVDFNSSFNIKVLTDTTAAIGSTVCFTVIVTAVNVDAVPTNNTLTHCFAVVASWDPNDKQVYPIADIDTSQEWLTYTIRFQNTGTAEAQHIYITDTLDTDIDVSSFQLLAYSHQPMVQLKENAVRFNFPNINLPDSNTNEPHSHGYVQYKVKLKDNLPIGTEINNTAFIYFDFNAPVVTNTTSNTIAVVSGLTDNRQLTTDIRLYPNPANDVVTISIDESLIGSTSTVSDLTGRKMAAVQLSIINNQLSIAGFSSGVYFITVASINLRTATKKLVIQQ
jgi:uncharacterized repeat protein (TIGR01451 family)